MKRLKLLCVFLSLVLLLAGCALPSQDALQPPPTSLSPIPDSQVITMDALPDYSGEPYVEINGNIPDFAPDLMTTQSSEFYTDLDQIGRCGACFANIGPDLMPTEERGSISSVHPSGWVQAQYDFVDGKSLYNRCHLIGFQLTGENANTHNLITGTRYLNVEGMLPFENLVAEYIRDTGNHVLYRVTPVFRNSDLVASGVQMEALSVEDQGEGICFNVYCYNVQPGVIIDYATGESRLDEDYLSQGQQEEFVLNTSGKKYHLPTCSSVSEMKPENRQDYTGTRQLLEAQGYTPCGRCDP